MSKEAEDLIFKLINNPNERLGLKGADEIKKHPFFKGVDWDNIRNTKAPFIPKLKNDYDTAYFETMEPKGPFYPPINKKFKRKDIEFFGYTFKESDFNDISIKDEFQNSIEAIKYMNRDKSNGESFDDDNYNDKPLDNNPDIKIENGGNNINNGIEIDKKVNNVNNNLSNGSEVNNNNTYDLISHITLINITITVFTISLFREKEICNIQDCLVFLICAILTFSIIPILFFSYKKFFTNIGKIRLIFSANGIEIIPETSAKKLFLLNILIFQE